MPLFTQSLTLPPFIRKPADATVTLSSELPQQTLRLRAFSVQNLQTASREPVLFVYTGQGSPGSIRSQTGDPNHGLVKLRSQFVG